MNESPDQTANEYQTWFLVALVFIIVSGILITVFKHDKIKPQTPHELVATAFNQILSPNGQQLSPNGQQLSQNGQQFAPNGQQFAPNRQQNLIGQQNLIMQNQLPIYQQQPGNQSIVWQTLPPRQTNSGAQRQSDTKWIPLK